MSFVNVAIIYPSPRGITFLHFTYLHVIDSLHNHLFGIFDGRHGLVEGSS